ARFIDVAGDVVELRPVAAGVSGVLRVGRHADRLEPVDAAIQNVRDAGQRLDVIDDRRLAERPFDSRERRLDAWPGPLAFQALDQAGLFTAYIGAGATVQIDIEIEAFAEDILAQIASGIGFVDRFLQGAVSPAIFVAQINVGGPRAGGVAGE